MPLPVRAKKIIPSVGLLHFDGTNGSTTFTDFYGHSFVNAPAGGTSNAALSTTQAKFGPSSLGTASGNIGTTATADFAIHTSDLTWESFFFCTASGTHQRIITWQNDGNGSNALKLDNTNKLSCFFTTIANANVFSGTGVTTVSLNTWHHGAVVRKGSNAWLFLDGIVELIISGTAAGDIGAPITPFCISGYGSGGNFFEPFVGFIDDARASLTARYDGTGFSVGQQAFIPTTAAFGF